MLFFSLFLKEISRPHRDLNLKATSRFFSIFPFHLNLFLRISDRYILVSWLNNKYICKRPRSFWKKLRASDSEAGICLQIRTPPPRFELGSQPCFIISIEVILFLTIWKGCILGHWTMGAENNLAVFTEFMMETYKSFDLLFFDFPSRCG